MNSLKSHLDMQGSPPKLGGSSVLDWLLVLASTVALTASVTHIYSMGVFIAPLETEFGWPRAEISAGLGVISVISVVLAPFVGLAIDRYGSRRIGIPGLIIYLAGVALLSTSGPSIWNWWALSAVIALGTVLVKPTVWLKAVTSRFRRHQGLAVAIALCGTSIGAAIFPFLAERLLVYGWRTAYLSLSGGAALVALPMVYMCFRSEDRPQDQAEPSKASAKPGVSAREGLTSPVFFKMGAAAFLMTLSVLSLAVHFVPILTENGISSATAASIAGIVGVGSVVGRLATGLLMDRYTGRFVGGAVLLFPIIGCVLLLTLQLDPLTALLVGGIIGLSLGAEVDVFAVLSARYFGVANYGLLFGTIAGLISFGAGVGPTLAGLVFDTYGGYDYLFVAIMPMLVASSLLVLSLGKEPAFKAP
ncbi:MFS family permease [Sphingobium sp. OAS761]|uniref:MFS transporter n=1 Tax=Sphingobium sp. OAS761 TaxID=2817901 RepID=UPI00209D6750|nr:MFS transporter [Sphingobium sp. OAS761]MCP1472293.1 MFS family permease [Sphingobium sp. OAS761]